MFTVIMVALIVAINFSEDECRRVLIIQQQVHNSNLITQCAQETKASKRDIANLKKKEIPTSNKGKCMLACVLNKKGLMIQGKFSSKNIIEIAERAYPNNSDKINKVIEILDSCGDKVNTEANQCELAYKLAHCTTSLSEKLKLM